MARQVAVFVGEDNNGTATLWVTDGTAAGTVPLEGIANTLTSLASGLFSEFNGPFFTNLNNLVYFAGVDAAGNGGLWQSDGTPGGTKEITGIAGTYKSGLNVSWMTSFGGKLYFQALNTAGQAGLWVSDGTPGGTHEITGIANTYVGNPAITGSAMGLTPNELFVFGGKLLFEGLDATGRPDLWSSDGSGTGTTVLSSFANTGGVGAPLFLGVVNGDLMFQGLDSNGINGLWKMAPGGAPQQVTGITGANANGVFSGVSIEHGQFAILGNIMLFEGNDAAGLPSLFIYDGNLGKATEITGIAGASAGLFTPVNFVTYNGKILFSAWYSSGTTPGAEYLWQSDGTPGGTTPITPMYGADLTVLGNKVLFQGNSYSLYQTNGTAAGTTQITPPNDFNTFLDPSNLTVVTLACFAQGTRLRTPLGEVAVERLAVGDLVVTQSGRCAPVRWLGHRTVDCRAQPIPAKVWPVRIAAGAFGAHLPARNLWLSPDHAVFADGALIPVRHLINGAGIVREPRETITYWHVELDRHDVILAEGLPCESYLDTGQRAAFANSDAVIELHPDFAARVWDGAACADLVVAGPCLERVRVTLRGREQAALAGHPRDMPRRRRVGRAARRDEVGPSR